MTLEERVVAALRSKGASLACAESCTGGLFGARLTRVPGAGDAFRGGVIAYVDDTKADLLHIDRALLEKHGAVSREVARAMATGARDAFRADLAVSITGFAGPRVPPGGELGHVYVALAHAGGVEVHDLRFRGEREAVRQGAADAALEILLEHVSRS